MQYTFPRKWQSVLCQGVGGGRLPIHGILRVCYLTGGVRESFVLQKVPIFSFCLTKGSHLAKKKCLTKVSPLKIACFTKVLIKKMFSSALNHTFWGIFWSLFSQICLTYGQGSKYQNGTPVYNLYPFHYESGMWALLQRHIAFSFLFFPVKQYFPSSIHLF